MQVKRGLFALQTFCLTNEYSIVTWCISVLSVEHKTSYLGNGEKQGNGEKIKSRSFAGDLKILVFFFFFSLFNFFFSEQFLLWNTSVQHLWRLSLWHQGRRFFFMAAHHMASASLVCFTHNAAGRRCSFLPRSYNSCCHLSTLDWNCMWTATTSSTERVPHFHIKEISSACWYGQSGPSKVSGLKPVLRKEKQLPASERPSTWSCRHS